MSITNQTNTSKRFSILTLPYEKRDMAVAKELIIDYENGHIYVMDKTGTRLISITQKLQDMINNIVNNGGDNITVVNPEDKTQQILNTVLENIYKYINACVEGLCIKKPARLLSDQDITPLSGLPGEIDGVLVNDGDDVLLINQNDKKLNGKWKVNASGNWIRSEDLNSQTELVKSSFFFIDEGIKYNSTGWLLTTDDPVIDSSELEFDIFSRQEDILAGFGLKRIGNEFSLQEFTTPNTATKVSWDEYGRIVSWENPTTLEEFGITNAVPLSHIGSGGDQHAIVTVDEHGFSSKEDKQIIDAVFPSMEQMEIRIDTELETKSEIEFIGEEPVNIELFGETVVIDNLDEESSTAALSQRQGHILKQLLDDLFKNTNEDGAPYMKLWMGTLNQYYNILNKDSTTLYISTDTVNENTAMSMGSNVEEIIMMLQLIQSNKVSKDGDMVNGDLIVGSSVKNSNLKVYGDIYINGVKLDDYYALADHVHDEYYTKTTIDGKLKQKSDIKHGHKIEDITGLQDVLDSKTSGEHKHSEYYEKQEIDFMLTTKAAKNHKHKPEDIEGILNNPEGPVKLYLKNMIDDPLHRTVTDAQLAKLEQLNSGTIGGSASSSGIINLESTHNLNPNAHPSIINDIRNIRKQIGNVELLSKQPINNTINELYKKLPTSTNKAILKRVTHNVTIDQPNTNNIPIGFTGFDENIHMLMVFKNSTYFHPNADYILNGDTIDLINSQDIDLGTVFTFVIMWIEGDVLTTGGGGSTGNVNLDGIYELLDNKSNIDHKHKLSELEEDQNHRTVTDALIEKWNKNSSTVIDTNMINIHNTDENSHKDIREKINSLCNNMNGIKVETEVIDLVPNRDQQLDFVINRDNLTDDKYGHFIIKNSVPSTDYVLSDHKLTLNTPAFISDDIKLVLFWVDGNVLVQSILNSSIGWNDLTPELKDIIDNKISNDNVYTKQEIDNKIYEINETLKKILSILNTL